MDNSNKGVGRQPRCLSCGYGEGNTSKQPWEGGGATAPSSAAGAWAPPWASSSNLLRPWQQMELRLPREILGGFFPLALAQVRWRL